VNLFIAISCEDLMQKAVVARFQRADLSVPLVRQHVENVPPQPFGQKLFTATIRTFT
jgi:hypothetical protein